MLSFLNNPQKVFPATIINGESLSSIIKPRGFRLFGVKSPIDAVLTFQTSLDNGATWDDIHEPDGNTSKEVVLGVKAGAYVGFSPTVFAGVPLLKVRLGTSSTPVTHAGDLTILLNMRGV